jgi:hypothetical protein
LEKKIQQNEKAVAAIPAGVGKPPVVGAREQAMAASAVASSASLSLEESGIQGSQALEDPNKGRFGEKTEANGRKIGATVKPFPGSSEFFLIHAEVTSTDSRRPLLDHTPVTFHLHPTFSPKVVEVFAENGAATLERAAWGAFTLGAEVEGAKLELDLATQVPDAPALFTKR